MAKCVDKRRKVTYSGIESMGEPSKKVGGYRPGSGRKKLPPEEKRRTVAIKVLPGADLECEALAKKADVSKAGLFEFLLLSPMVEEARRDAVGHAHYFTHRAKDAKESLASTISREAVKRLGRPEPKPSKPDLDVVKQILAKAKKSRPSQTNAK